LDNTRLSIFKWWSMIRWFMVIVLFSIGMLHMSTDHQKFPEILFISVFFGVVALNLLFQLNSKLITTFFTSLQVLFDIIFATLVVHLTGGLSSYFVWIYLMGVITASLMIPQLGGLFAGFIGSVSLFGLIMLYQFNTLDSLTPMAADISTRTIYIISYTALFCGVAMIISHFSDLLQQNSKELMEMQKLQTQLDEKISEQEKELKNNKLESEHVSELIKAAGEIANLDHELNTPLCIISLSIGRVNKIGLEKKDTTLLKSGNEITEALNKISVVLQKLNSLKNCVLKPKELKGQLDE